MAEWSFQCWSCRQVTEMQDKVTRSDECPHCRNDMRSCKNCKYYDPGYHNECTETISEYIPDKERSNFMACIRHLKVSGMPSDLSDAKAVEALFKNSLAS